MADVTWHRASAAQLAALAVLALLCAAGLFLLWRLVLSPAARRTPAPRRLSPWPGHGSDFVLFLICVCLGGGLLPGLAVSLLTLARRHGSRLLVRFHPAAFGLVDRQVWLIAIFESGLIAGILTYRLVQAHWGRAQPAAPAQWLRTLRDGLATFLIALPVVMVATFAWRGLLLLCGIDAPPQDVADLFLQIRPPGLKALFILAAAGGAPLTEEMIFRAGIFRFLLGRIPRGWAVFVSALIFGAMHLNPSLVDGLGALVPLVLLGVIFALAYERTGRVGTVVIAHALFNLNTLAALLCGLNS